MPVTSPSPRQKGGAGEAAYGVPVGTGKSRAEEYLTRMGDALSDWQVTVTRVPEAGAWEGAEPIGARVTVTGVAVGWLGVRFRVSQTAYAPLERFTTETQP